MSHKETEAKLQHAPYLGGDDLIGDRNRPLRSAWGGEEGRLEGGSGEPLGLGLGE